MQVLSVDGFGANLLNADAGPAFATRYNTLIAEKIAAYPERFTAFAHLPMTAPLAAADELERAATEHGFRGAQQNSAFLFIYIPVCHPKALLTLITANSPTSPVCWNPSPLYFFPAQERFKGQVRQAGYSRVAAILSCNGR